MATSLFSSPSKFHHPPVSWTWCILHWEHVSLVGGGGGLALWHLPLSSRNRALRSSCSVALQPCCDLKFWTLFEVDLLSVPFALLTASIDCSHCYYHSRHVCRRPRSVPPQPTDQLPALFSLLLLILPHFFPPLTFDKIIFFTSFPTTLLITRSPRSTDYLPTLLRLLSSLNYFSP